jgi:replicative DNA helicase
MGRMNKQLTKEIVEESLKIVKDLSQKEFELKKARIEVQHEILSQKAKELEGFKSFKIGGNDERIHKLREQNKEYIELAKKGSVFLKNDEFKGLVPLFPRNMILVGAQTGDGKSTLTANMTYQFLAQGENVLVITNEEHPTDIMNRVICLTKGWSYHDHTSITPEQQAEFDRMYPILSQKLEIIDDNYNGVGGLTTTLEGIKAIQKSLLENEKKFGIIIYDYFQNTNTSNKNPSASGFEVLHEVGRSWDIFKNQYNAPIIILSQLKAASEEDKTPFKERIEGRKSIYNFCTCAIEVKANKETSTTEWIFKKSRFAKAMGVTVKTGFDRGRYVPYNREFAAKVERERMEKQMAEIRKKDSAKINEILGAKQMEVENA